jgi:hypothetical protein
MNPVHINKSYFFKVNFNIIFAPRDPKWSIPFRFYH